MTYMWILLINLMHEGDILARSVHLLLEKLRCCVATKTYGRKIGKDTTDAKKTSDRYRKVPSYQYLNRFPQ